ncbi:hypothetical protein BGZ76_011440 [Entomortierella beljakovae]|nr:hypothetical protein BGZ76_011440 [Entomortierella beljakovae]
MAVDVTPSHSLRRRMIATGSILTKSIYASADSSPNVESVVINSKIPPHHTLTSLSLTHVQFAQNDLISKLLAYVTLTPLCIICGYVAVVLTSRDLKPLVMFAGQLANELLNLALKHLVKQARPTEYLGDGYGMPSSHSQFMAYFATYMLILMYRSGIESVVEAFVTHSLCTATVIWSLLVVYSRF